MGSTRPRQRPSRGGRLAALSRRCSPALPRRPAAPASGYAIACCTPPRALLRPQSSKFYFTGSPWFALRLANDAQSMHAPLPNCATAAG
eukprot:365490-Chlamydomonas_euryale.AAC.9